MCPDSCKFASALGAAEVFDGFLFPVALVVDGADGETVLQYDLCYAKRVNSLPFCRSQQSNLVECCLRHLGSSTDNPERPCLLGGLES